MTDQAVTLQQGIWIDQQRLGEAGLRDPYQISVRSSEIRIWSDPSERAAVPAAPEDAGHFPTPDVAWDVFRSLGDDAQPGRVVAPAVQHDRYLYRAAH